MLRHDNVPVNAHTDTHARNRLLHVELLLRISIFSLSRGMHRHFLSCEIKVKI